METLKFQSAPSTQRVARELVLTGHTLPFAVLADTQSEGRGRLGRSWKSETGGLWLTIAALVPSASAISPVALVAASTVAQIITTDTALNIGVKWPNDLLIGRRKVCGVLAESLIQFNKTVVLLGVGLNVNNRVHGSDLTRATSLCEELGHRLNLSLLASTLIEKIHQDIELLATDGFESFLPWLRSHLVLAGEVITVEFNGERQTGRIVGLSDTGSLLLAGSDDTVSEVSAGTVESW